MGILPCPQTTVICRSHEAPAVVLWLTFIHFLHSLSKDLPFLDFPTVRNGDGLLTKWNVYPQQLLTHHHWQNLSSLEYAQASLVLPYNGHFLSYAVGVLTQTIPSNLVYQTLAAG